MALIFKSDRFPTIISQRQIDLENNWWKDRIELMDLYIWSPWTLNHDSSHTTLNGYRWKHHQIQLGPLVIEYTIRGRHM